ncbi:major facilitator superfamily domain-containing protein [Immersiella caudata]|uniref:Major facilitator superfamily domain-containing protein n=1 Tax=Immersiella caudata TaxID=314043 RepID=A0AA39X1Y1_9PEZI|nr:major facilitator superfamily domain-containing protein [Immersiella caudata]
MTRTHEPDERAPLLGSNGHANNHPQSDDDINPLQSHIPESHSLPPATAPIPPSRRIAVITLLSVLSIALALCGTLATTAVLQDLEDIICRRVHGPAFPLPGVAFEDDPCKDDEIMSEITMLMGWYSVFALLPGLVLAVPFGAVADRYGRVVVLGLSLLGVTINTCWIFFVCLMDGAMDLRFVWLGNLAGVIGGGPMVFTSMMYTAIADVSTDEQRTAMFFYIGAVLMGGSLVSHPITYLAMQVGTWFAWTAGLSLCAGATVVVFCMPETLDKTAAAKVDPVPLTETERLPLLDRAKAVSVHTFRVIRWLFWEQRLVGFLLLSLTFEILGKGATAAIQQLYISKRYHLTFAEADLMDTVSLIAILVVLTIILPYLSHFLLAHGWSSRAKDLRLAQGSALLTALGCLLMAVAETIPVVSVALVIYSLGVGYTFMIRGLMTSLAGGKDIGLLYSSIGFVEAVALMSAAPFYSYLFKIGMSWGGRWVGLPYLVAGVILVGAAFLVGGIKGAYVDVEDEGETSEGNGASRESEENGGV